jgi:hypothetical protein
MSLLFTENNPEQCSKCGATQFVVSPIVQITKDKKEQHVTAYRIECIVCENKRNVRKNYFEVGKR